MKIILLCSLLIMAWKAGYVLLMAGFLAGFYLVYDGTRKLTDGNFRGRKRIDVGAGLGIVSALLMIVFNLGIIALALASLAATIPGFASCAKAALSWLLSF